MRLMVFLISLWLVNIYWGSGSVVDYVKTMIRLGGGEVREKEAEVRSKRGRSGIIKKKQTWELK